MDIGCAPLPCWGVRPDIPDIDSWRPKAEDLTLLPIGFAADEGLSSFPVVDCRADVRFEER